MLGLDGVSVDMLKELIERQSLPNLEGICKQGIFTKLKTTIPSISAPSWSSLYTGMNPGKHGVYDFVDSKRRLISSVNIKGRKLWKIVSDSGLRCCILNALLTYPVEKINGYMISSWLSPTNEPHKYAYPPSLADRLENRECKLFPEIPQAVQNREELLKEYYDIFEKKGELAVDLLSEEPWDLFFWVIYETDHIQHHFYDDPPVLKEFFQRVDRVVGSLLKVFRDEKRGRENGYVFIVSDHGFGPAPSTCINIQALLPRHMKNGPKGELSRFWNLIYRAKPVVDKLYAKIPWIMKPLMREIPPPIRVRPAGIYIDRNYFSQERYNALCTHIVSRLRELKDENGCPVFKGVWRKEELYHGSNMEEAPDIAYLPREEFTVSLIPERSKLLLEHSSPLPGSHHAHPYGTLMMEGPDIKKNNIQAEIIDILPTILYILRIPIPHEIDGRILLEAFTSRFTRAREDLL